MIVHGKQQSTHIPRLKLIFRKLNLPQIATTIWINRLFSDSSCSVACSLVYSGNFLLGSAQET